MSKLPPKLPGRDTPHPRDSLISFPDLSPRRGSALSPATAKSTLALPKSVPQSRARNVAKPVQKHVTKPVSKPATKPTPGRPRGRPSVTIAKGMSRDVRDRKFAQIDKSLAKIKKGTMSFFFSYFLSNRD